MSVKLTTAYWKIKALKKKIKIIQGGQGASKTYSILIDFHEQSLTKPYLLSTVATDTYPRLQDGALLDMEQIFRDSGMDFYRYYNGQKKNLTYPDTKAIIQFRNVDKYNLDSGKGPRRNNLFLNEANRLGWGTIEHAWNRTKDNIYADYNPDKEFWYHENLKNGEFDKSDLDFLTLTYLDNECIDEGELNLILKKKLRAEEIRAKKERGEEITHSEANQLLWWEIYGEGQLGVYSDRQIYSYEFIDKIPTTAKRIPSGLDFGFNPDPTTLIDLWIDGVDIYADEVFTLNNLEPVKIPGMERMAIVDKLDEVVDQKGRLIIADSSGGRSIADIRDNGYNIYAVKKDKLVVDAIKLMRSFNLFITKRSPGIKKAVESWHFKIDNNGNIIPEPDGHEPDQLAAIRYVLMMKNKLW